MQLDKITHIVTGAAIVALIWPVHPLSSVTACLLAAVGKEVYDAFHRDTHTPDGLDALATVVGGAGAALWLLAAPVVAGAPS